MTVGITTTNINFALVAGGHVSGRVSDAGTGGSLGAVSVEIFDSAGHFVASGSSVDPSGNYTAATYKPGDGMPAGEYAVLGQWPDVVTDDPALGGDRLRGRYNDRQKPVFTVEVKAEPNSLPPFDVK